MDYPGRILFTGIQGGSDYMKMKKREIYITDSDMERLESLLMAPIKVGDRDKSYLRELAEELHRAEVLSSKNIPNDVITMNSRVRLRDLDSGERLEYTLVFPNAADASQHRISILAPIGTALIGYRVGDDITWEVPKGQRRLRIEEIIYQPKASEN